MINDTFNFARFGLLCRQTIHHHYKLIATALIGFCGAFFLLLLFLQLMQHFRPFASDPGLFVSVFMITGVLYTGTAFPELRTREKAHWYLMIPASTFEKFLIEVVLRGILFVLVMPLLYWLVFNLEGNVVQIFYPEFSFQRSFQSFPQPPHGELKGLDMLFYAVFCSGGLIIFLVAFTGAATFAKMPFLKTLFAVAVIFFFNLFIVYFFLSILEFRQYYPTSDSGILAFNQRQLYQFLVAVFSITIGALFIATYLKIKEKEV